MSDLISRQAAIDAVETIGFDFSDSGLSAAEIEEVCEAIGEVRQAWSLRIKRLPSAQPVIRCKDCKHFGGGTYCYERDDMWDENDFCSYAERRTDE